MPEDEALIEALARAACEADGFDPDAPLRDSDHTGEIDWSKALHKYALQAKHFLAMMRAYEEWQHQGPLIPNHETIEAMQDARAGRTVKAGTVAQLLRELEAAE